MESNDPLSETSTTSLLATTPELPPPTLQVQQVDGTASPSEDAEDQASIYWSVRSRLSFSRLSSGSTSTGSFLAPSSGRPSQDGGTWKYALTKTMNSGFASGTPRSMNYKGVREGREKEGFLPRITGVGRTGKGPAAIPQSTLKALGVRTVGSGLDTIDETKPRESKAERARREAEEAEEVRRKEKAELSARIRAFKDHIRAEYLQVLEPYGVRSTKPWAIRLSRAVILDSKIQDNLVYLRGYLDVKEDFARRELGYQGNNSVEELHEPEDNDWSHGAQSLSSRDFFEDYRRCFDELERQVRDVDDWQGIQVLAYPDSDSTRPDFTQRQYTSTHSQTTF